MEPVSVAFTTQVPHWTVTLPERGNGGATSGKMVALFCVWLLDGRHDGGEVGRIGTLSTWYSPSAGLPAAVKLI